MPTSVLETIRLRKEHEQSVKEYVVILPFDLEPVDGSDQDYNTCKSRAKRGNP